MRQGVTHRVAPLAVLILGCGSGASASRSTPGLSASPAGAAPLEIAVARTGTGNPPQVDIVWMDSNGRHRRVLVGSSGNRRIHVVAGQMAWSPDGRRLAFAAEVGRSIKPVARLLVDIFVVRADGSGLRRLTHTGSAREPIWSPDRCPHRASGRGSRFHRGARDGGGRSRSILGRRVPRSTSRRRPGAA
jgi:hypothetical protein